MGLCVLERRSCVASRVVVGVVASFLKGVMVWVCSTSCWVLLTLFFSVAMCLLFVFSCVLWFSVSTVFSVSVVV